MTPAPELISRLFSRHSIRTRLLLWTVGLSSLVLAVVIGWNYQAMLHQLDADAQRRAAFIAEASADKIDTELGGICGLAHGIAYAVESQALGIAFEPLRTLMQKALLAYPQIYGIAIVLLPALKPTTWPDTAPYVYRGADGLNYANLTGKYRNYTGEDWFYLPRYLDQGTWSEPYRGSTGVMMVTYSAPIRLPHEDGAQFAGVVAIDIELGWLDQALAELPIGRHGYSLLMSHQGTYISHPIRSLILNESIFSIAEARGDPALRAIGQRMISGKPGLVPWENWATDEPSWLAWHPLETIGWTMGTVVPKAELYAEIRRFTQQETLVGLLGLALLVAAVWLVARSITRPVRALNAAATTLAAGDLDAALPAPRGHDEVAELTAAFASMRDHLRRYIADLAVTTAARERMNGELRIAHDIQMDLVPKTFPAFPERDDLDLFAVMEPAREVGGDFYDFFMLDADRLVIAIGDVSGKGVPAALFMAVTRSFLRSAFRVDDDPGRALTRVNDDLAESNEACMFVTLFCAVVSLSDGWVAYANAGHNPPLIVTPGGHAWIGKPFGPAAGALSGSFYASGGFQLFPESMLLLYTDGVTEAMNPVNQLYGNERLAERLETYHTLDCRDCLDALLVDIRVHADGTEQSDDITMLTLKRITPGTDREPDLTLDIVSRTDDLNAALDQVEALLEERDSAPRLVYAVRLVMEELLTNTIKYGYDDAALHRIRVAFTLGSPATLRIEDDGHPFDPTAQVPDVALDAPVAERPIGGLGLNMVRSQTASLTYRRDAGINRLDIVF